MKVLVKYQPDNQETDYEGAALLKTTKNALNTVSINYGEDDQVHYDVIHLFASSKKIKTHKAPKVLSAFYLDADYNDYIEYRYESNARTCALNNKGLLILNSQDLVIVPNKDIADFLLENGVTTKIQYCLPSIDVNHYSNEEEKHLFYHYYQEKDKQTLVTTLGTYKEDYSGIEQFIESAKQSPDVLFYYFSKEDNASLRIKKLIDSAPENAKFKPFPPLDIYRSALMNSCIHLLPGYQCNSMMDLFLAMAAKCQIIARKNILTKTFLNDGDNAYVAEFSETLVSLVSRYLEGKLKPTNQNSYQQIAQFDLKVYGEQLKWFYQQELKQNNK